MQQFTRQEFKITFGFEAVELFNIERFLTTELKTACMRHASVAILLKEYGSFFIPDSKTTVFFALDIAWWIIEGRQRGRINTIFLFDNESEMAVDRDLAKATSSAKAPTLQNQN